jgi:hypothetical protein
LESNDNNTSTVTNNAVGANKAKGNNGNTPPFGIPQGYQTLMQKDYDGALPSHVSYEPFTQTSYWERQEIRTQLQNTGTYYVVVSNDNGSNNSLTNGDGKFTLAIGETEDFSAQDFFMLLPYSWIKVKIFFNDYLSISVAVIAAVFLAVIPPSIILIIRKKNKNKNKRNKVTN